MADLIFKLIGDPTSAASAFKDIDGLIRTCGQALAQFAKDSLREYAAAERAEKQLARAAGEMSEAFKAQASAMQQSLGVSDDMVVKMQTMLLRFGEAPEHVGATVKALLDYSAATGTDAVAATDTLMSSVESGKAAFRDLGIQYSLTGKASKDVEAITAQLAAKIGGAADADAETLTGRTNKATEAWADLQKAFGGFLDEAEQRSGVLDKLTTAMRWIGENARMLAGIALDSSPFGQVSAVLAAITGEKQQKLSEFVLGAPEENLNTSSGLNRIDTSKIIIGNGKDRTTAFGRKQDAKGLPSWFMGMGDPFAEREAEQEEANKKMLESEQRLAQAMQKIQEANDAADEERWDRKNQEFRDIAKRAAEKAKETEKDWQAAGMAIGSAFTSALAGELAKMMDGGPMDFGNILGAVLSTGLGALNLVVPGLGTLLAPFGSLIGKGVSNATKRHDGGWVERFHGGGWPGLESGEVPIIAQAGEHVLSRRDVANMGGPAGVQAAKSGAGMTVNISTMDATGTREFFERGGGRALYNAMRTGRGSLRLAFGG